MSQDLALALAADLDATFPDLVRAFQDRLYSFALRLLHSRQDAEESVQDAFVRAYRALAGYPPEQRRQLRLRPWLYRITLNVVRNRVRRPTRAAVDLDGPGGDGLAASPLERPERVAEDGERRERLVRALAGLPRRYASAVVLRHVQGLSYAEVAEVLDQPVGTTKSDVHRGLRLLREALEGDPLLNTEGEGVFSYA
jgi:RNA polymerase sigma-70 factor (ECF subfamily)